MAEHEMGVGHRGLRAAAIEALLEAFARISGTFGPRVLKHFVCALFMREGTRTARLHVQMPVRDYPPAISFAWRRLSRGVSDSAPSLTSSAASTRARLSSPAARAAAMAPEIAR
jgi:hypothetical protein